MSIPGAQGGANWGCTAADPSKGIVYVLSINVPSIYKLSTEAPAPGGGRAGGPAAIARGRVLYEQKCQSCHGADLRGSGNYPSLVDITVRMGPESLREVIVGGRPGMPPSNDLSPADLDALCRFSEVPTPRLRACAEQGLARRNADGRSGLATGSAWGRAVPPGRAAEWLVHRIRPESKWRRCDVYGYGMESTS